MKNPAPHIKIIKTGFGILLLNFIAAPPYSLYVFWIFKGIAHFFAEMSYVDCYGVVVLI